MNRLSLPKERPDRQDALRRYIERASSDRRVAAAEWWVARHYLRGCRYFETIEYQTGRVRPVYGDAHGQIPFRYEELVNAFITEVGRLHRLDTRPSVSQVSAGLNALKNKATAQAILDGIYPYTVPKNVESAVFEALAIYGCVAQYTYKDEEDVDKENPQANIRTEVIYPWNLLFLPSNVGSPDDAEAVCRDRWVPLSWLNDQKNYKEVKQLSEDDEDLEVRHVKLGSQFDTQDNPQTGTGGGGETRGDDDKTKKEGIPLVHLYEVWSRYPNGRLRSYDILVGRKLVHTDHFKNNGDAPMFPIGVAVRGEGIGPYGRSFVIPMIPLNAEVEAMLANIFRQMQDFDVYGQIGIPVSMGIDQNQLSSVGPGSSRYFMMDKDPMTDDKIEQIQPVTGVNMLSSVATFGLSLLTRMGQQPEMLTQGDAPGRVDSEKGLNFLYQASTIPLGMIASSIARCYATVYKKQLCLAKTWDNFTINLDSLLDDFSVIGLRFDHQTGMVDLSANNSIDPVKVDVTIKSEEPVDKEVIEQKLTTYLQQQLISPAQFKIEARLRGLNVPLPNESEWQNYRTAVIRNLILFGDGIEPGILPDGMNPSEYDNPEIHLMVVQRLMSSPEFALAEPEVQEKFSSLIEMLRNQSGQYPDALEYPEEAAALEQQMMQGGGQGMEEMMSGMGSGMGQDIMGAMQGALSPQDAMI